MTVDEFALTLLIMGLKETPNDGMFSATAREFLSKDDRHFRVLVAENLLRYSLDGSLPPYVEIIHRTDAKDRPSGVRNPTEIKTFYGNERFSAALAFLQEIYCYG
jgi:hypothetical protein